MGVGKLLLNGMYIYSARPLIRLLHLELYLLIFGESGKIRLNKARLMKEYLSAISIRNEPKPPVAHQLLYLSFMHLMPPFLIAIIYNSIIRFVCLSLL